jgi:hypothetical protein
MPLDDRGMSRSEKFDEVRHGKGFRKMARKFGRTKARKYMIARVLESERKAGRGRKKWRKPHRRNSRTRRHR